MSEITYTPTMPDDVGDTEVPSKHTGGIVSAILGNKDARAGEPRWWRTIVDADGVPNETKNTYLRVFERFIETFGPEYSEDERFLYNVDVRRLVDEALDGVTGPVTINGEEFSAQDVTDMKMGATTITVALTEGYKEMLLASRPQGADTDPEYEQRIDEEATLLAESYLNDEATLSHPEVASADALELNEDGQLQLPGQTAETSAEIFGGLDDGSGQVTPRRFMTDRERIRLITLEDNVGSAVDQIINQDLGYAQMAESGVDEQGLSVDVSGNEGRVQWDGAMAPDAQTRQITTSSNFDQQTLIEDKSFTLTEVLKLPLEMSVQERIVVQKKMVAAGLLPSGYTTDGNPTDQTFKAAWKNLAGSALAQKTSMVDLLDKRRSQYQDAVSSQLSTRLTDPARIRINGNAIARQMIGRKLTDAEHAQMTQFVHNLERQNTQAAASLDPNGEEFGVEQVDENVIADIDAQMEQYLRNNKPVEAGANDMADQFDAFTGFLAGPGRGVR